MYTVHTSYTVNKMVQDTIRTILSHSPDKTTRFVDSICMKAPNGVYTEDPVLLFYQENPQPTHSNFFAFFRHNGTLYVTKADAEDVQVTALLRVDSANDGTLVYSRFRHDYFEHDGLMVDGGKDYLRTNGAGIPVKLNLLTMEFEHYGETHVATFTGDRHKLNLPLEEWNE